VSPRPRIVAVAVVVAITVVGLVLPLVIADHGGALGIARNDDWSYLRALFHWRDTGHLDFNHWVSMTLLGQLLIARPVVAVFGNDITAVQILTAVTGLVGLIAILWLGVMMTGRMGVAGLVALALAASPVWGPLAVSFMTDVPAFALTMVACALGFRAFRGRRV
jgi:4-amino-4-deoxy-L-arabinose transferase-like glycosyltransferase